MRASYRAACQWIADNDNSGSNDTSQEIEGYITAALVADIFGKTPEAVALTVAKIRRKQSENSSDGLGE